MADFDPTGQFGVVRSNGKYAEGIKFFQAIGQHDDPDHLYEYTHAFIATSPTTLVEAWPGGARETPISAYTDILWSRFDFKGTEQPLVVDYTNDRIGDAYAWEAIPLIALALATGEHTPNWVEHKLANPNRWICSAMVDAALQHGGIHLFEGIPPAAVYPAMLARLARDFGWLNQGQ